MTRKDFELIAQTLAAVKPNNGKKLDMWDDTVRQFAHVLAQVNPRFDKAKFKRACGLEEPILPLI
jgi:hypothetical protein